MSPKIRDRAEASSQARLPLFTIGYEGRTLTEFLDIVADKRISAILDVRRDPVSRKKGFSKTALKEALAERGIEYVHLPELGVPRDIRQRYLQKGEADSLQKFVHASLAQHDGLLRETLQRFSGKAICFLCFERDPAYCHRSLIANHLARKGLYEIHHL
ncbi:MAG: DUF488 domain-containing protein [bacterium]